VPIPFEYGATWAPEPVWTPYSKQKFLAPSELFRFPGSLNNELTVVVNNVHRTLTGNSKYGHTRLKITVP
jgi:hypothetical protein